MSAISRSHRQTLDGFYEAEIRYVAAGGAPAGADFSGMAAFLHPEVAVHQGPVVPYAGEWKGIDALQRFFKFYSQTWSSLDLSETQYFEGPTGVAIFLRMRAVALKTGLPVDTRIGQFITFEDGLIRKLDVFYLDPDQVRIATTP
jgi:hypothetical protein